MSLRSDRSFLRDVQYRTDANLAARQSIYAYQQPPVNLAGQVLDVALPAGRGGIGVVADVRCGNGVYLAELARRERARHLIGVDMSPGMLRAVITAGLADLGHRAVPMVSERFGLDQGEVLLRGLFASVARYEFRGRLVVPGPEPVATYVRSMSLAAELGDPEVLVRAVVRRLPSGPGATFLDTTHSGCLVCA
ncbi:MAG TPA: class I SAM-dependent methyltransferase [Streptosporangiaceae bacterium]|nr:class I SAM-dependent methyltransferase [Streptosporangiaceae bacterium]